MDKWYGFIELNDGNDLFFHGTDLSWGYELLEELHEGDTVEFELWQWRNGKDKAINIQLIESAK